MNIKLYNNDPQYFWNLVISITLAIVLCIGAFISSPPTTEIETLTEEPEEIVIAEPEMSLTEKVHDYTITYLREAQLIAPITYICTIPGQSYYMYESTIEMSDFRAHKDRIIEEYKQVSHSLKTIWTSYGAEWDNVTIAVAAYTPNDVCILMCENGKVTVSNW